MRLLRPLSFLSDRKLGVTLTSTYIIKKTLIRGRNKYVCYMIADVLEKIHPEPTQAPEYRPTTPCFTRVEGVGAVWDPRPDNIPLPTVNDLHGDKNNNFYPS